MKIFKSKSFNIALALSLTMSTCYTQAFWPTQLIKKGFAAVTSKLLGASRKNTGIDRKKLALGITVAAAALVAVVYGIFKISNSTGQTGTDNALLKASEEGNLDEVRRLHEQGANLECRRWKHPFSFDRFIIGGLDNTTDIGYDGALIKTPMSSAVVNGHVEIIKFLLDQGVNVESDVCGIGCHARTPLRAAVRLGNIETIRCLVENGANINRAQFDLYETPISDAIFFAREKGRSDDITNYLINNGAFILTEGLFADRIINYWTQRHGQKYIQYFSMFDGFKVTDLLTTNLYKSPSTNDLEKMVNDPEDCPCCLRQRALAVLCARYKQDDPILTSKKESLEKLFETVPFNEWFLQDLHRVNAIKFIVQNNITDKFGRSAATACTQCCQDEDVIDAITANHF